MIKVQDTFASLLSEFQYHVDLRTAFDDFLTIAIITHSFNPARGKTYDEALYNETIGKYQDPRLWFHFPKMFVCLAREMEARLKRKESTDILGEFYEQHLYRNDSSHHFTPWPVCSFIARSVMSEAPEVRTLRILDPRCGSGRMLIAASKVAGSSHELYGIDVDHTYVRMTALNLFINGIFQSEVMWVNALDPDDFRMGYRISLLPFGIFRIAEKEKSRLRHLSQTSFKKQAQGHQAYEKKKLWRKIADENGVSQLRLF